VHESGGRFVSIGPDAIVADEEISVLLVEDDDGDALLVEDELAERLPRARVLRSRTLQHAVSALGPAIDCVLLDLGLPDASGLGAVARLRVQGPTSALIVLTGLEDEAAGVAAVAAGAQDYLVKGLVDGDQLVRSIRYAIGRRQAEQAERELLLAEAQAREVSRLERGLAPKPLLGDAQVWVESCYRAGRSRALLGGDFFDLVQTDDGNVHVVVGDVCGNGPDEAAIGVSMRAAWRALALAGHGPDMTMQIMQHLFEHERHLPALFATLCTLTIEPSTGVAWMLRAGHPPPLLIAGGAISSLPESAGNSALGMTHEQWLPQRLQLPPDWAILLYSDGIIEGRTGAGPRRLGEAGLRDMLGEQIARNSDWRHQPKALLEDLIASAERMNGDALSDDVAMMLLGARTDSARP
jgi:serine phosphatase RsbU (regulator of sigma subunit)